MGYAQDTEVPIEKSRTEIETLVRKSGATKFVSSWDDKESIIIFVCRNRLIRFKVPMPTMEEAKKTVTGKVRHEDNARKKWLEKEGRRRWRALLLCIKAKLESVSSGIETFDEAFLSHIVTDDKRTVYERILDTKSTLKMLPPAEAQP
jgi:hypothetical protein